MTADKIELGRNEIISALGEERVHWKQSDLMPFTKDTYHVKFGEDYRHTPDMVVLPESTADVQKIVEIAAKYKIPLIPKGGGSNRTGMLVPIHGGIIVDTIKMNRILEIDEENFYVTTQPGITLLELEDELNNHGLALNQEQGSMKVATIGGAISTAGFSRKHNKYGTVADRIMSLEVVLADGRILRTGPKVLYTSTGIRLHQLFIGAEGTLGIITEATLRVEPLPEANNAVFAFYDDFWSAKEAAKKLTESGVMFAGGEAYETPETAKYGAPEGKTGVFYALFEGTAGEVGAEVDLVKKIVEETGGFLADEENTREFISGYTSLWCGTRALHGFEDSINSYVPMHRVKEFYERLQEILPRYGLKPLEVDKYSLDVGKYSLAYRRFIIPDDEKGYDNYQKALREVAGLVTELGGSIAGCHGVGIEYRDLLNLEFSEVALETMRKMKKALDPNNIMNPGKKIS